MTPRRGSQLPPDGLGAAARTRRIASVAQRFQWAPCGDVDEAFAFGIDRLGAALQTAD